MERKTEIKEITLLQSFGIFLVVLGHSYIEMNQHPEDQILTVFYWFHNLIYSFHMPLFMFISGFLFSNSNISRGQPFGRFITSRFKRILVPYVVISSFAFPIKALLTNYASRPLDLSLAGYLKTMLYPFSNTIFFYWFLPTLFIVSIVSFLLSSVWRNNNRLLLSLIIFSAFVCLNIYNPFTSLIFNIKGVAHYLIYFWGGCLFYLLKDRVSDILNKRALFISLSILLLALNYFYGTTLNPSIKLFTAFTGIFLSLSFTYVFLEPGINLFRHINGFSYPIYLLSWFPQIFFKILLSDILHLGFYVSFIFMLVGGLIFPVAVAKLASNRSWRLGFIIGLR